MSYTMKPSTLASICLYFLASFLFPISLYLMLFSKTILIFWEISSINTSWILFPVILDPLGVMFSSVVLFISANVMMFASTYMEQELFLKRFIHLVLLFVLSMNMLIFFPHLITLLLGWDGLGLVSFILVIYYQNSKSLGAGMITALTNRIGDVMLLLSIGWTLNSNNWLITNMWNSPLNNFIILSILIAAMTKSAQMPFSSWLPAAMAAPTPVSALVHSSTLVTAGVFLLIRFYDFLSSYPLFNSILLVTSTLTMFMAGMAALAESDLKKIIALSTLSQLGVMMMSLAMGYPKLAFFHLITHALFKALLFICAGSIIHFHTHGQDLRTVGNLTNQLPLTMSAMLIANMSLCGMPFLAGFYSKDLILELSFWNPVNWAILVLLILATSFTAAYSTRLTLAVIWNNNCSTPTHFISNNDTNILTPAILLTSGAIIAGALINWFITPMTLSPILPLCLKTFALFWTLIGAFAAWSMNPSINSYLQSPTRLPLNHEAISSMWFLAPLSTQNIMKWPLLLAHSFQKTLDHGWVETMTAQGAYTSLSSYSLKLISPNKNSPNTFLHMMMFLALPISAILMY